MHEEKQRLLVEDAERSGLIQRMEELDAFMNEQTQVLEYDEGLVRKLIERITAYDDHLVFEFKSGIETEVKV